MFETINLSLDRTERSLAGGLAQHHVQAAMRLLTGGIPFDQLEALHAAATGRPIAPNAWRVPRAAPVRPALAAMAPPVVARTPACSAAALRVACNAICGAS